MTPKEEKKVDGDGHPVTVFDPRTSTGKDVVDFMLAEMDKMIAEEKKTTKKV
jgi:hypothetical protein